MNPLNRKHIAFAAVATASAAGLLLLHLRQKRKRLESDYFARVSETEHVRKAEDEIKTQNKICLSYLNLPKDNTAAQKNALLRVSAKEISDLEITAKEAATKKKSSYAVLISAIDSHPDPCTILNYLAQKSAFVEHQRELDACGGIDKLVELFVSSDPVTCAVCAKVLGNIASNSDYHCQLQPCIAKISALLDKSTNVSDKVVSEILPLALNLSNSDALARSFSLEDLQPLLDTLGANVTAGNALIVLGTLKVLINLSFNPVQCVAMLQQSDAILTPLTQLLLSETTQDDVLLRVLTLCRNLMNRAAEMRWSTAELENLLYAIMRCKESTLNRDVEEMAIVYVNLVLGIAKLGNTAGD